MVLSVVYIRKEAARERERSLGVTRYFCKHLQFFAGDAGMQEGCCFLLLEQTLAANE